jgi:sugar (pentulose or hexulose) kinase
MMTDTNLFVISLDCSTSSSKAIVWDMCGNMISQGKRDLEMYRARPDWHEQVAESWWIASIEAIREAISQVDPKSVVALCISHQRETFVPVDVHGKALRNAILWMDERARDLLPKLNQIFGEENFHEITGKPLSGNLSVSKIAWMKQNEPDIFADTYLFLDVQAYLVHLFTGNYCTGWGSADPMGLFNMQKDRWSEQILGELDLDDRKFPEAFPPGEKIGTVTNEAAEHCNLQAGIPVIAGVGDGQSAGLGINITHPGECYLSLGTGMVAGAFSTQYVTSKAFRTMYSGIPGTYILETVLLAGAYLVKWFVDNFTDFESVGNALDLNTEEILDKAASKIAPGAQGLMLVPYWNSAMNPYWDASASGIMVGWRGFHQRAHMYRAILEGIAFEQRLHTEGVEAATGRIIDRYIAVGGGAANSLWCQIIADITGKTVFRTPTKEATSLGSAVLAAYGGGIYHDINEAAKKMTKIDPHRFSPDEERQEYYDRLYQEVYKDLYPKLQDSLARLSELSTRFEKRQNGAQ